VKEKFGGLRFYLQDEYEPACCRAWAETRPAPIEGTEAEWEAWCIEHAGHEATDEHQQQSDRLEQRRRALDALIDVAESASFRW
jgi:hypothetical protein